MQRRGSMCNDETAHFSVAHSTDTNWEGYRQTRSVPLRSNQQGSEKHARIGIQRCCRNDVWLPLFDRHTKYLKKGIRQEQNTWYCFEREGGRRGSPLQMYKEPEVPLYSGAVFLVLQNTQEEVGEEKTVTVRPKNNSDLIPWAQKIEFESCK